MSQATFSFTINVARMYYGQYMVAVATAASQCGLTLNCARVKGIVWSNASCTVAGEETQVVQFSKWLDEFARLNPAY